MQQSFKPHDVLLCYGVYVILFNNIFNYGQNIEDVVPLKPLKLYTGAYVRSNFSHIFGSVFCST